MSKTPKHTTPFKLESAGPVSKESSYLAEQNERKKRNLRLTILALCIGFAVCFIWASAVQYKLLQQTKSIQEAAKTEQKLIRLEQEIDQREKITDSLLVVVGRLKNQNDLLAEISPMPNGIFFEVQLGGFNEFKIEQYLSNLAALHTYKYHSGNKLLLGRFRSFKNALQFESDLKRMGIKNAKLVGSINGKVVTYQEALDALKTGNN